MQKCFKFHCLLDCGQTDEASTDQAKQMLRSERCLVPQMGVRTCMDIPGLSIGRLHWLEMVGKISLATKGDRQVVVEIVPNGGNL